MSLRHLTLRHISTTLKQMQGLNSTPPTFFERFELALQKAGITKTVVARSLNLANSTISRWSSGAVPRPGVIADVANVLGVSREWLERGKGPLMPPESSLRINEEPMPYITTATGQSMPIKDSTRDILLRAVDAVQDLRLSTARHLANAALEQIETMISNQPKPLLSNDAGSLSEPR